jgi:hypothetical protein
MFMIVFGVIIFSIVKNISVSMHNNKQPIIPVEAKVVTKRYNVSSHHNSADNNMHHSSSTFYYVTFELNNGERIEFPVPSYEFGMMVEGDNGTLSFQGTRFISFIRI